MTHKREGGATLPPETQRAVERLRHTSRQLALTDHAEAARQIAELREALRLEKVASEMERGAADKAEADADKMREVEDAARAYYDGWMQDEAADDGPELTGCSDEQHEAAKRLKEALAALTERRA